MLNHYLFYVTNFRVAKKHEINFEQFYTSQNIFIMLHFYYYISNRSLKCDRFF